MGEQISLFKESEYIITDLDRGRFFYCERVVYVTIERYKSIYKSLKTIAKRDDIDYEEKTKRISEYRDSLKYQLHCLNHTVQHIKKYKKMGMYEYLNRIER